MTVWLQGFGDFLAGAMGDWQVPGLAIAIVQEGNVVFREGFGLRDLENDLQASPNTRFAIGSTTKAFTTMAMGILVDEGKLDWDTPVRHYLPTFKLYDPIATERLTPRDLVTHRSGLPRHDGMWVHTEFTRQELFERLQYLEPSYDLRTVYQYNNLMFMAAGYLVGGLSDSSWEEFVRERILDPLGMESTNSGLTKSPGFADFALPYAEMDGEVKQIPFFAKDAIGPAGSLSSSVTDMAAWLQLHLNKGKYKGQRIISEDTLSQMHTPQMVIRDFGQLATDEQLDAFDEIGYGSYGLGWRINPYRGTDVVHHAGMIDGFSALVSFMPQRRTGVVVLTNLHETPLTYIITFNVYDRLLGLDEIPWGQRVRAMMAGQREVAQRSETKGATDRKMGTRPSHPLEDYVGNFEHPGYGAISIALQSDRLEATFGNKTVALQHYHYDTFDLSFEVAEGPLKVSFFADVQGDISHLSIPLEPAVNDIVFRRVAQTA
jgi:CubicO group peptidase (beta-lactamase class C family)